MYPCPRCHQALVQKVEASGISWHCDACGGQAMGFAVLRRRIGEKRMAEIWGKAFAGPGRNGCTCPMCSQPMTTATVDIEGHALALDLCQPCGFIWFDAGEYEIIPPAPPKPHVLGEIDNSKLPLEMREKLAMVKVKEIADQANAEDPTPDEPWKAIPSVLGLPIEIDSTESESTPWATYLLSLGIATVSIAAFFNLKPTVESYGLIPDQMWRDHGLTLLTSFFLHGSPFHLIGNLYFLLIFGRAVENNLGPWRWLLIVLVADQTGNLVHILGNPHDDRPCIGASGGISGLITYYALKFPHARLGMLLNYGYVYWRWIQFPAWVAFLLWILLQTYGAWAQMSGFSNVSALAHFGGVASGVVFWLIWRKRERQPAVNISRNPLQVKIR